MKKAGFLVLNWDILKNSMKIGKITKLYLRGKLMHKLLYKKEQRKSRRAVNIEPKFGTVLLKAGQLESMVLNGVRVNSLERTPTFDTRIATSNSS